MTKEDFLKLGIDEAVALKCEAASQEELKGFISKESFKEELQKQNKEQKKIYDEELVKLRLENAIKIALSGTNAKNPEIVGKMLDMSKIKLDNDGKLSGFNEQIEVLKKSDGYMFNTQEEKPPVFKGFQPGASGDIKPDASGMTLEQLRKLDPNKRHAFSVEHPEEYKKIYEGGK